MTTNMDFKLNRRDTSIDILRFIAISGIILAYSNPGTFLTQLRGFDVVLMVFLSAVCVKGFDGVNTQVYLRKRSVRLILPVWIFFSLYYIGTYLVYYLPPFNDIFASFTFTSDLYVWIIRILVALSLLSPIIWKHTNPLSATGVVVITTTGLILSELLFESYSSRWFDMVFMTIPYLMIYILGMNIKKFSLNQLWILAIIASIVFITLYIYYWNQADRIITTSEYKYPPRLYYTSYGIACTLLLWICRKRIERLIGLLHLSQFTKFVGSHTYWLYLWHIPIVDVVGDAFTPAIRFILIFGIALACVTIQSVVVTQFVRKQILISIFNG